MLESRSSLGDERVEVLWGPGLCWALGLLPVQGGSSHSWGYRKDEILTPVAVMASGNVCLCRPSFPNCEQEGVWEKHKRLYDITSGIVLRLGTCLDQRWNKFRRQESENPVMQPTFFLWPVAS